MLVFILTMHLFLDVPLYSRNLWGGSLLTYLIINLIIDVSGISHRFILLGVEIIMLVVLFIAIIKWPFMPSLLTGLTIMVISGLLYVSLLH